jgi:hypothetical protein
MNNDHKKMAQPSTVRQSSDLGPGIIEMGKRGTRKTGRNKQKVGTLGYQLPIHMPVWSPNSQDSELIPALRIPQSV